MPDINSMKERLTQLATIQQNQHSDGDEGSRGDLFGEGVVFESYSTPQAPQVVGEAEGQLRLPFSGRVIRRHYVARVEVTTEESHPDGAIIADYAFTFSGKVLIANVRREGSDHKCGDSLADHVRSLNGQVVT